MKLSAPIHVLKRRARALAREQGIPLHEALDRTARDEGYKAWSLLAARTSAPEPARKLLGRLDPGDLVLLAARPGQGKTLMSLELTVEAMKAGRRGVFFTLDYTRADIVERFRDIGEDPLVFGDRFAFDDSDAISGEYIIERLQDTPEGTVVVIDYLQLLDQKRDHPALLDQVRALRSFARDRGLILVFISQIDRSYDPAVKPCPGLEDVRLPNPLDLSLFSKTCFLNDGEVRIAATA